MAKGYFGIKLKGKKIDIIRFVQLIEDHRKQKDELLDSGAEDYEYATNIEDVSMEEFTSLEINMSEGSNTAFDAYGSGFERLVALVPQLEFSGTWNDWWENSYSVYSPAGSDQLVVEDHSNLGLLSYDFGFKMLELSDELKAEIIVQFRSNQNPLISNVMDRESRKVATQNKHDVIYQHLLLEEECGIPIRQIAGNVELEALYSDLKTLMLQLKNILPKIEILAQVTVSADVECDTEQFQYAFYAPEDSDSCYAIEKDYESFYYEELELDRVVELFEENQDAWELLDPEEILDDDYGDEDE